MRAINHFGALTKIACTQVTSKSGDLTPWKSLFPRPKRVLGWCIWKQQRVPTRFTRVILQNPTSQNSADSSHPPKKHCESRARTLSHGCKSWLLQWMCGMFKNIVLIILARLQVFRWTSPWRDTMFPECVHMTPCFRNKVLLCWLHCRKLLA